MKLLTSIIAVTFLSICNVTAQTIKLKLAIGMKYETTNTTTINSVATVMGQEMANNIDNSMVETIEVKATRPNETDLTRTISKIVMNIEGMGQNMTYDSDKKDNEGAMAETFDKMKSGVKSITVDGNGKIIKEEKDPEEIPALVSMGINTSENLPGFKNFFTGREVKAGLTWYDSTTITSDKLSITTTGNYAIQTINTATGTVTIVFNGKQSTSGTIEQMGQEMSMTSSSKVTSQFEIDIATGLIRKSSETIDGTSTVEAGGMSIPVTTKTTITVSTRPI